MTVDQLVYNLPFEFNDYITGERKEYVFDYAVVSDPETTGAEAKSAEAEPAEGEEGAEAPEPINIGINWIVCYYCFHCHRQTLCWIKQG